MKPGDLVIARMRKSQREKPKGVLTLYDWRTSEYHMWKKGDLGIVIEIDNKSEGAIVMADGNVGWVSQAVIEVIDEAG